jgi:hypothetical protein
MRRLLLIPLMALGLLVGSVSPALAITGGQPDGEGHPYEALLLVPGTGFCSGTLIDEDVILTAGHCTHFFDEANVSEVLVSFSPQPDVDDNWSPVDPIDWYVATSWTTHEKYVDAEWPFTYDYGLLYLDRNVTDITPALLPSKGLLDELVGSNGQTAYRFLDVGYGVDGVDVGGGPPTANVSWTRKVAVQRYRPGQGAVSGVFHETWFTLGNVPSPQHGAGCPGDSGSAIYPEAQGSLGDTVLAVHTGGYSLGKEGELCGRITSLNQRVDIPEVLNWINKDPQFVD